MLDEPETVVEAVDGAVPVIAGISAGTADAAIAYARDAAGVDAVMCLPPLGYRADVAELIAYYEAVADGTGLPVMLYDIPGRSGVPITTETMVRLAEHPRIVANKDAKGDLGRASWAIATTGLANTFRRGPHATYVQQALIDVLGIDARVEGVPADGSSLGGPAGVQTIDPNRPAPTPEPATAPPRSPSQPRPSDAGQGRQQHSEPGRGGEPMLDLARVVSTMRKLSSLSTPPRSPRGRPARFPCTSPACRGRSGAWSR